MAFSGNLRYYSASQSDVDGIEWGLRHLEGDNAALEITRTKEGEKLSHVQSRRRPVTSQWKEQGQEAATSDFLRGQVQQELILWPNGLGGSASHKTMSLALGTCMHIAILLMRNSS